MRKIFAYVIPVDAGIFKKLVFVSASVYIVNSSIKTTILNVVC